MLRQIPWIRLLIAGFLLAGAVSHGNQALGDNMNVVLNFGPAMTAVICLVAGCIVLASTLVTKVARPLTGLIDRIYFGSNDQDDTPPINLRLPRGYRAEGCFTKSVEECERQLEWHSLAPELWAELILAHRGNRDRQAEAAARSRALKCLGMVEPASRFDQIIQARNNLPEFPTGLPSQFQR